MGMTGAHRVGITSINGSPGPPRIVAHHVW
jgi:hypothetical protein